MRTTISKSTWKAIYRLLDLVSPIDTDCGQLCGAACCSLEGDEIEKDSGDFELGIYLYPGEEQLFTMEEDWLKWTVHDALDYEYPDSWIGNVYFVRCTTPPICPRKNRPLQCRIYPLTPHLDENDKLTMILNPTYTPYKCPLIEDEITLNASFVEATTTVWKRLIKDPHIYDLVKMDSIERY